MPFIYPNPKRLECRGIKTFYGMEGQGFNATVYADGKKALTVIDDASGGPLMIEPIGEFGKKIAAEIVALCQTIPPTKFDDIDLKVSPDLYFDELVNFALEERRMAKARAKGTLFRLKDDKPSIAFRTVTVKDKDAAIKFLDGKFPNNYVLL